VINSERYQAIQQVLFREARLLDNRRYRDWLAMLTDDIFYVMPTRYNRLRSGRDEDWAVEKELDELPFFEEDRASLTQRVERFYTGMAWTEEPPSRTRHLITNIEVEDDDQPDQARVFSNFLAFRSRLAGHKEDEEFFFGAREDVFRCVEGDWKLARRRIITDSVVLNAQNLSLFL
jgi:3-phenylpropionate/cinnamic acid dioxygenase small subunit